MPALYFEHQTKQRRLLNGPVLSSVTKQGLNVAIAIKSKRNNNNNNNTNNNNNNNNNNTKTRQTKQSQ